VNCHKIRSGQYSTVLYRNVCRRVQFILYQNFSCRVIDLSTDHQIRSSTSLFASLLSWSLLFIDSLEKQMLLMKRNLLFHALLCSLLTLCSSIRYDCCVAELSSFGDKCSYSGTTYGNETYYCVSVAEICPNCMLTAAIEIESASCYQCCSTDAYSCGISVSFISTSTWCKFLLLS
jgi:hypothetical protein